MNIDFSPRNSGKTKRLIEQAHRMRLYIVTPTHEMAGHVAELADSLNMGVQFPLTFEEFLHPMGRHFGGFFGPGIRGFLFDDLDVSLQNFSKDIPIYGASVSVPERSAEYSQYLRLKQEVDELRARKDHRLEAIEKYFGLWVKELYEGMSEEERRDVDSS